jgi:hypothetical protein
MDRINRKDYDRRSEERRKGHDLFFMNQLGEERRQKERRSPGERRSGWARAEKWQSVPVTICP